jgi:DNA-binding LytR/AlgR family response regulator
VIVNLDYVSELNMLLGGYGEALLKTDERLEVSRRRLRTLMAKLEGIS